jgi:ankyrin repeat protein
METGERRVTRSQTRMRSAVVQGDAEAVRDLLATGIDKNQQVLADVCNGVGTEGIYVTILALAASRGHTRVARELLAAGCDKDKADVDGNTALMQAAISGHEGVVRELLAAGCDRDKTDVDGATALMLAAHSGHEGVVRELLAAGCDKDKTDVEGFTALMLAADNIKMVFRNHFQDLFLAFTMAGHTRLGAQVSKAKGRCFIKDVLANKDLLQVVFQQGVLTYK